MSPTIAELSQAIEQEAEKCPEAQRLMSHPGVGALTALAFVLILGQADRVLDRRTGRSLQPLLGVALIIGAVLFRAQE